MREMATLIWPGRSAEALYVLEQQAPGENPGVYVSRKKFPKRLLSAKYKEPVILKTMNFSKPYVRV